MDEHIILTGPKGDTGDTGPRGPEGARGAMGFQGDRGPKGEKGERGPKGDRGALGLEGVRGKDGKDGKDGNAGPKGDKGDMGPKGEKGDPGKDGDVTFMRSIATELIAQHEDANDHDPFLLGSHKVSEAGMKKGDFLQYDGEKLVYATFKDLSKKVSSYMGRGFTLPDQAGHAGQFLMTDGHVSSWGTPSGSGSGDVVGPASAVSGNIALFDGITGKLIQDSGYTPDDFADALGADDNYVTDAEKTKLSNLSGTNTGDQVISDATLTTSDITTNNVSATKHGFVPKAPNDSSKYLDGTGNWSVPPSAGGGITRSINSISTDTTAGASASTDYVYFVEDTTTLTLPTAVGNTNQYIVKNTGTDTVTVDTTSAQTIDGSASVSLPVANTSLTFISNGSNWFIV